MNGDNGIEVEGLVREFKKGPRAVDGIDLTVAPGEIYGFLGPNGAGKSTTVHMLTTLLPPTAGTARVAGHDIVKEGPEVRDAIGVALQEAALDQYLTAREHMRLQAGMHGLPKSEAVSRGDELIARVGLSEAADRKVGGYSGGMRRRLDLALALVHQPRILFLDEPTTGLDVQSRTALWDEVQRWRARTGSPSSSPPSTWRRPTRSPTGSGSSTSGKIVAEGTPDALKAEIGRPTVEAVPAEEADTERMRSILVRFGSEAPAGPGGIAVRLDEGSRRARRRRPRARLRRDRRRQPRDPRADARRRLPRQDGPQARGRRRRARPRRPASTRRWQRERRRHDRGRAAAGAPARVRSGTLTPGRLSGPPVDHPHDPPADHVRAQPGLPALPARGQRERALGGDLAARVPDRLLPHLRPRADLHAGGAVRDHGRRPVDRRRHPARLLQSPPARRRCAAPR